MKKIYKLLCKTGKILFLTAGIVSIFSYCTFGQVNATLGTLKNSSTNKQRDTIYSRMIVDEQSATFAESEDKVLSDTLQQVEKQSSDNSSQLAPEENTILQKADASKVNTLATPESKFNKIQNQSVIVKPLEISKKTDEEVLPENEKNTVPKQ